MRGGVTALSDKSALGLLGRLRHWFGELLKRGHGERRAELLALQDALRDQLGRSGLDAADRPEFSALLAMVDQALWTPEDPANWPF